MEEFKKGTFVGTTAQVIDRVQEIVDAGADYLITSFPRVAYDHTMLNRFAAQVMPHIQ